MKACFVEVGFEFLERCVEFGNQRMCLDFLFHGYLLLGQNTGAIRADLAEMLECMRQLVDEGVDKIERGKLRIQRQQIFIGGKHFE